MHDEEDEPEEETEIPEPYGSESKIPQPYSGKTVSLSVQHVMIGVFVLGLAVGFSGGIAVTSFGDLTGALPVGGENAQQDSANNRINITSEMLENEPNLGEPDAPLKIVEYSDYGCPWCAEWAGFNAIPDDATRVRGTIDNTETLDKLKENYVETGEAQFIFKDYPVSSLHPTAPSAHKAANCILDQESEMYWDFHDMLFRNRDIWMESNEPLRQYENYAETVGANASEFTSCYENSNNSEVEQDKGEIEALTGRLGTPAIFIGNEEDGFVMIQGAQPYSSLKNVIDEELQKARR